MQLGPLRTRRSIACATMAMSGAVFVGATQLITAGATEADEGAAHTVAVTDGAGPRHGLVPFPNRGGEPPQCAWCSCQPSTSAGHFSGLLLGLRTAISSR